MPASMPATTFAFHEGSQQTFHAKYSSTTFSPNAPEFVMPAFSANASEFVPSWLQNDQVPEFTPYQASQVQDFSSYSMTGSHASQYASYGMAPNTGCAMFNLDDYSDFSSEDDEPSEKPPAKLVPPVVGQEADNKLGLDSASEDEDSTPTTCDSPALTDTPDTSGSDKDQESDQEGHVVPRVVRSDMAQCEALNDDGAQRFSIPTLLKLRHSIDWLEGLEDELAAMEVAPEDIPNDTPDKPVARVRTTPASSTRRKMTGGGGLKKGQEARRSRAGTAGGFDLNRGEASKEELAVTDSSWTCQQRARRSIQEKDVTSDEEVLRAMRSNLNKLTLEKFKPVYEKLVSCGIRTTLHVETLIQEIFEKATTQHHFTNMYADLCVLLHEHFVGNPISDDPRMSFKKVLLNGCQSFFERHLKPPADLDTLDEEEREAISRKFKMRMLGNIKFVGTLLVKQMLASKVLFAITDELLTDPTAETLESLACLLTVVGPRFDSSDFAARPMLTAIFNQVQVLTKSTSLNCRVRFLLKDVLELRACQWKDRKPKKVEAASTLKEVADNQAAEEAGNSVSRKCPPSTSRRSQRTSPSQNQGGKSMFSLASQLSSPSEARSGKLTSLKAPPVKPAASEGYQPTSILRKAMPGTTQPNSQKEQGERPRKQPGAQQFDQEACRKEVSRALAELRASHDVEEAMLRISALDVPSARQPEELCDMLVHMSEEGCVTARKVCFELVVRLFGEGHWKAHALDKALQDFTGFICADLQFDVPSLPGVLRDELHPALAPLVQSGTLKAAQHDALIAAF